MAKYNISGGSQGAVGDNARAKNFTQNSVLIRELTDFAAELHKRAKTPEQSAAAKKVVEAQEAAKNGDDETMREKLKAAGGWALKVAKEIGVGVAVKAISGQFGLGE